MKKILATLLAFTLILVLFCGCGAVAKSEADYAAGDMYYGTGSNSSSSMAGGMSDLKAESSMDSGWAPVPMPETGEAAPMEPQTQTMPGSKLPVNVKLIYTANIDLESVEFDGAVQQLNKLVDDLGGYYENSELNNYNSYRRGYYTVRVPAENFNAFCEGVGGFCQVNSIYRSATDISEQYYDTESRLLTQQTKLKRLQELLEQAEIMEDIITLESAISETEYQIEQLTGSLRKYDSLVGYSTITVSLTEVYKLTDVEQPVIGFGAKLVSAFKSGCSRFVDNVEDFLIGFARAWVGWLIFIVIAVLVILWIRRGIRRGRERRGEKVKTRKGRKVLRRGNANADVISETKPDETDSE